MKIKKTYLVIGFFLMLLLGFISFWLVWHFYDAQLKEIQNSIEQLNKN